LSGEQGADIHLDTTAAFGEVAVGDVQDLHWPGT
jgi:hypothetical protein